VTPLKVDFSNASFWEGVIEEDMEPPSGYEILRPGTLWAQCGAREPDIMSRAPRECDVLEPREHRKLGLENPKHKADILCAFRPPKCFNGEDLTAKSYPDEMTADVVEGLLAAGHSVAAVGGKDNYFDSRMADLRGIHLTDLCGAMRQSKCVIGPSSGPIHLASLCEANVVTWNAANFQQSKWRYSDHWNPFNSPVSFIESATNYKHPDPVDVVDRVLDYAPI
jgi:hypothetical protein